MQNQLAMTTRQATIYVTEQSMATVQALVGLDECDRDYLNAKPETQMNQHEGYYLNSESMRLTVLLDYPEVALCLSPKDMGTYFSHISYPIELRGVVFSGAPTLPKDYATILGYWSPLMVTAQYDGAETCQNQFNEYEVKAGGTDVILSNGVVLCIRQAMLLTEGLRPEQFIEIHIPVDTEMLSMDREKFDSDVAFEVNASMPFERIHLKVQDILESPDPDFIAIAVLHTENHDADYCQ